MFSSSNPGPSDNAEVDNVASIPEVRPQDTKPDLSNPKDLLLLDEHLRKRSSGIPKLCKSFCSCFSLSFGSYIVANITVGSSIVGAWHMVEELTAVTETWMDPTSEEVFDKMIMVAICLHTVLFSIGILILYGLIKGKIKVVKYASLALLLASVVRIVVAVLMLFVSQDIEVFLFFIVNAIFYLYGFVILWSYAIDEEESQRLNILANYETEEIVQRFGNRISVPPTAN